MLKRKGFKMFLKEIKYVDMIIKHWMECSGEIEGKESACPGST